MTAPADIPTRFMADWLAECLTIAIADMDQPAVEHFAARLKTVLADHRYTDREAA